MLTARTQVADRVVGLKLGADDVQPAWLRRKLEPNPRHPQFILTLHGLGYKFVG